MFRWVVAVEPRKQGSTTGEPKILCSTRCRHKQTIKRRPGQSAEGHTTPWTAGIARLDWRSDCGGYIVQDPTLHGPD